MKTQLFSKQPVENYFTKLMDGAVLTAVNSVDVDELKFLSINEIISKHIDIIIGSLKIGERCKENESISGMNINASYYYELIGNEGLIWCNLESWINKYRETITPSSVRNSRIYFNVSVDSREKLMIEENKIESSMVLCKKMLSEINYFITENKYDAKIINEFTRSIVKRKELL